MTATHERGKHDRFFMAERVEMERLAKETYAAPLYMRIFQLAMADVKNPVNVVEGGHTAYGNSVLRDKLAVKNKDGTLVPAKLNSVNKAIAKLVEWGYLDSRSEVRCLVVPNALGKYGQGEKSCPYHGYDGKGTYLHTELPF